MLDTGPSCTAAHRCDARTSCSRENLLELARESEANQVKVGRKGIHFRSRSISEYLVEENSTIGENDKDCDTKKTD